MNIDNIFALIDAKSVYNKEKAKKYGEVFTPWKLINKMCGGFAETDWLDSSKTWLDPCAGLGNIPAVLAQRLMIGLQTVIPDETERYRHIMEKQIYMGELQHENAIFIERTFNPERSLKLNLYVGDFLIMPEDFFDLPFEERIKKYRKNYVWY